MGNVLRLIGWKQEAGGWEVLLGRLFLTVVIKLTHESYGKDNKRADINFII